MVNQKGSSQPENRSSERGLNASDQTDKGLPPVKGKPGPRAKDAMRTVDVGIDHVEGNPCNEGADTGGVCNDINP